MQPRGERRFAAETSELAERPNERLLRELSREFLFAGETKGQPKDPRCVRVVQLARGQPVSCDNPGNELGFSTHWVQSLKGDSGTRHIVIAHHE
jgi:hypothetical protein